MSRAGVWAIVAVLVAGAVLAVLSRESVPPPIAPGQAAPGFELPTLGGETVRLSDLEGQVVLVNFWATWCKPCEEEMPSMQRLYQAFEGRPFQLLAVSVDDATAPVQEFRERFQLDFPILLDPEKRAAAAYQAYRFPETVLIDARGEIVGRFIGPREWDSPAYVEQIRSLLPDSAPAPEPAPAG